MSWLTRRSYLQMVIRKPMNTKELRNEFCKLPLANPPSPELLLYHSMLAIDRLEHALRDVSRLKSSDAWIFASETLRAEGLE